jgi:hypothetical protein
MAEFDGTICSCIGVVLLLAALGGSQSGRLRGDTLASLLLNTLGGVMATVGAILDRVWAFAVLNGIWALLSAFNIARKFFNRNRRSGENEENQEVAKT